VNTSGQKKVVMLISTVTSSYINPHQFGIC
jgi:hypothetical protein